MENVDLTQEQLERFEEIMKNNSLQTEIDEMIEEYNKSK